jgi:hypothetical protein
MVGTVTAVTAVVVFLVGSAAGQESSATIRTYQGLSHKVTDLSLEVFYTIGEPKEKEKEEDSSQRFQPTISVMSSSTAATGGEQLPFAGAGAEKEAKLLRGHSRMSDITVSSQGVETRIALDQIRSVRFARKPVATAGLRLPPYIPYYRYSASVSLTSGAQVEADYVNMGGAIVRGTAPSGQLDIPWEEVESIVFER